MRLLVDAHVLDGKYQGTRTYIEGIYRNMVRHEDIEFYFAAVDTDNLERTFGAASNIHYVKLKSRSKMERLAVEFPLIIRKHGIDCAHFQYISPLVKTCKEIVTIHDLLFLDYPEYFPWMYRVKNKFLFRRSARRADLLLTVSPFSRDEIVRHFCIPEGAIKITPNGVTLLASGMALPDVKNKFGLDRFIMTVSRIEPRKNHQLLLQAWVELKLYEQGIKLVFVGAKDMANKAFSSYYGLLPQTVKDNVVMVAASYPELMALYKTADLFVFPSLAEGFGIPPLEAAAMGCPVLCSNQTAMADFDFFGECLFHPCNIEELKTKMVAVLNGTLSSQKAFIDKYDWALIADNFYNMLKHNILPPPMSTHPHTSPRTIYIFRGI